MLRTSICRALAVGAIILLSGVAQADEWPSRPIKWIVPYGTGTAPDMTVRVVAEALWAILKQPVVVDNKPGAAGNLGAQIAANAKPDGYTLVYSASPMATNMRMYKSPGFDVFKDFIHVSRIATSDMILVVRGDSDIRSVKDLIEKARKNPGKLNYGSGGNGTPAHLGAELLLNAANFTAVHIPYKGASDAVNALLADQIDFSLPVFSVALSHVLSGRLRGLAVSGAQRNPKLPDVPTFSEAGVTGVTLVSFGGLSVPAGTPAPIVKRLNEAVHQALENPAVRAKLDMQGGTTAAGTPEQYTEDFRTEIILTEKMMSLAKLKAQ